MSDPVPPEAAKPDGPVLPLDYARPRGPAGGVPFIGQMAIGFGAFVVMCVVTLLAGAIGASAWGSSTTLVPVVAGVLVLGLPILLLAVLTIVTWRRWRWRGFLVGVLVGLGLVLLAAGLCFAAFA